MAVWTIKSWGGAADAVLPEAPLSTLPSDISAPASGHDLDGGRLHQGLLYQRPRPPRVGAEEDRRLARGRLSVRVLTPWGGLNLDTPASSREALRRHRVNW